MKSTGNPWGAIEKTTSAYKDRFTTMYYIPREEKLLSQALQIVFLAKELQKPDSERLSGYRSSQLESLKRELLSQAPVYREMEESLLADYLAVVKEKCLERGSTAYITTLLEGKSPEARAHEQHTGQGRHEKVPGRGRPESN